MTRDEENAIASVTVIREEEVNHVWICFSSGKVLYTNNGITLVERSLTKPTELPNDQRPR